MYRTFLRKIDKMDISEKGVNENGYHLSTINESKSKMELNYPDSVNFRTLPNWNKNTNSMKVLFLFPERCYQMKNIRSICDPLNIRYTAVWSVDVAIQALQNNDYDIVIVDRRQYEYDQLNGEKFMYRVKKDLPVGSFKIISFSESVSEDYLRLCDQGYDEQWIQYDETYSLRNYLASYVKNQFSASSQMNKVTMLQNIFDNLNVSVEILNSDFNIEVGNITFQKLFDHSLSEVKGKNWFELHKISTGKVQPIVEAVRSKKSWSSLLSDIMDQMDDSAGNLVVCIKCLNDSNNQFMVTINSVPPIQGSCEESMVLSSFEQEPVTITNKRKKETFINHSQICIESPILKIMKIIKSIQDLASPIVNHQLQKIIEILSSKDLFITTVDSLKTDKMSSNLIDGLLSNNATIFAQTETRRHSSSLTRRRQTRDNSEIIHDHINQVLAKINKIPEIPENEEMSEIDELLKEHQNWSFDIIRLERLTECKPLGHLGMKIFHRCDLGVTLGIDPKLFQNWLYIIESNYNESNTYHNSTHAADVLQSSAWFLERRRINEIFDSYDDAISIIAAIVHDLGHPGRTNPFLINSNHNLAVLYNDIAVLENHHVSFAFKLTLKDDRINIFKNLNSDDYRSLRHGIIDAVLATEMAKHFEHLTKFVNIILKETNYNGSLQTPDADDNIPNGNLQTIDVLTQPENKAIIRRMLIKCSDVNNPTRPFSLSKEWAYRISEEYFNQTDDEISRNIPVVMPQFNRATCNIPQSQITFMEIFLEDMFRAWDSFADTEELLDNLRDNKVKWRAILDKTIEDDLHE